MANKMTKREVLGIIKSAMADNADVVAFCDNEVALLDKKNEYRKAHPAKPTKAQEAAFALKQPVIDFITANPQSTSKAIADALGVAFQKVTPILTGLVNDGILTSEKVKTKTVYSLVE